MSASGPGKWSSRLEKIANIEGGSLTNVVPKAALLPIIAALASLADLVGAVLGIPINIASAFGEGLASVATALTGGSGQILQAGATESAESLTSGVWAQFGPFTFPLAVGIIAVTAYIFAQGRSQEETGNFFWFIPDLPGPLGAEEEDED
ncbi:hypothetical protein [Haloplanus salilacus]|uniref:hypothetical protein n=1 Tax=Haloplanus salilacus TaxID=2949994 RepID=UPI0030D440F1